MKGKYILTSIGIKYIAIIVVLLILTFILSKRGKAQDMTTDTITLKELTVTGSYSATKLTPFTFKNLPEQQIQGLSFGTDPAVIIAGTPSVTWYSDNGDGYGYTYWRLRGIDQTRLNATLNGVPLNEPEDQGIYYNNYGGFVNAISSIQIIRGAGLSKPGVASYGGSINFNSLEFSKKFSGFANVLYGMDTTRQLNVGINSPHFFMTASLMTNAGFKEHSYNHSRSIFYGVTNKFGKNEFFLYGFVGWQENGMAWIGEPLDSLKKNPFYNSNTPQETDDFLQTHSQFIWKRGILKTTIYYTSLRGSYGVDMSHFDPAHESGDLINTIDLKSSWVGTIINVNPSWKKLNTNLGISAYTYIRNHEGSYNKYNPAEPYYYFYKNTGTRNELAPYVKGEYKVKKFSIYGDAQYRYTYFGYEGSGHECGRSWIFFNWSTGVSYKLSEKTQVYYGIGKTSREPTRNDLFAGNDNKPDVVENISPESSISNELGIRMIGSKLNLNVNLYYMNFKNEIVLNGKYGPNSVLLHQNAAHSFRSGVEVDVKYSLTKYFDFSTATTLAYNRIKQSGESLQPVLSPWLISNVDAVYNITSFAYFGLNMKVNSNSYIDFTNEHYIPAYAVYSCYGGVLYKGFELKGFINNLEGKRVINNANIGFDGEPKYFATQFRFWTVSLTYRF